MESRVECVSSMNSSLRSSSMRRYLCHLRWQTFRRPLSATAAVKCGNGVKCRAHADKMRCALALFCGDCSIDFGRLLLPQRSRRSSIAGPGRPGSAARKGRGPGRAGPMGWMWQVEGTYTNQEAGSVGRPGDTAAAGNLATYSREISERHWLRPACVYAARVQRLPGTKRRVRRTYTATRTRTRKDTDGEEKRRRRSVLSAWANDIPSTLRRMRSRKMFHTVRCCMKHCFTRQFQRELFPSVWRCCMPTMCLSSCSPFWSIKKPTPRKLFAYSLSSSRAKI